MNEKLSITLPAELVAAINEQVELGRYASTSDMLQQAVQSLIEKDHVGIEPDIEYMRMKAKRSLEDPRPPIPLKEGFARLRSELKQR